MKKNMKKIKTHTYQKKKKDRQSHGLGGLFHGYGGQKIVGGHAGFHEWPGGRRFSTAVGVGRNGQESLMIQLYESRPKSKLALSDP